MALPFFKKEMNPEGPGNPFSSCHKRAPRQIEKLACISFDKMGFDEAAFDTERTALPRSIFSQTPKINTKKNKEMQK